ncbi:futalosine hydrolase [Pedobacter insulae]|uniref:Futalosine hydrolase n=1 Tax=Pedobacter insulae TaxID=414048 RepID=A0A1I2T5F2_9SPHI|nr:futalosine hydrolase [Pedobacter insulae]SFG57441.1 futalosine hydrolase [Pedobacter insulae]
MEEPMREKTLIVAATYEELAETFDYFKWAKGNFVQGTLFDVIITGVGMTATAFALGKHLSNDYSLVLNVGIAGSFDKNIALASLVNIRTDTFSELGAEDGESFLNLEDLGFGKCSFTSGFTSNIELIKKLPAVSGITVNTVHGNIRTIHNLLQKHAVQTESMEGAAVFYACQQMNIPVLQVRSISNYVEQRNKEAWKIGLAIKNLNEWLINYINFAQ